MKRVKGLIMNEFGLKKLLERHSQRLVRIYNILGKEYEGEYMIHFPLISNHLSEEIADEQEVVEKNRLYRHDDHWGNWCFCDKKAYDILNDNGIKVCNFCLYLYDEKFNVLLVKKLIVLDVLEYSKFPLEIKDDIHLDYFQWMKWQNFKKDVLEKNIKSPLID